MLLSSHWSIRHFFYVLVVWLSLVAGPLVAAETGTAETLQTVELEALNEEIASQQTINQLDAETRRMTDEYWTLLARQQRLARQEIALETDLQQLTETLETLHQQLRRVPPDADLDAFLQQLVDALDQFIRADLPFQREARLKQVEQLALRLQRPDASPAERLRQILLAYQRELEYGRDIETYDGELIEDPERTAGDEHEQPWVTYLRYGRVALVYQHLDGEHGAWWDRKTGEWQPLDPALNREVRRAIRMARKQMPPDLVLVPLRK
ncbi:DUF3450 domain-containing protein [Rhabdochromatium marinum]|uniref:DUF3450 domain-containing protein n=1 Tax=Rhabdochromatium marinum TaxID=48729 RepID=UPI001905AC16|nr:DUF3450 domain-containing protein [Rhabdochromatium marinum]